MSGDLEVTVVVPGSLAEELRTFRSYTPEDHDDYVKSMHNIDARCFHVLAAAVKRAPRPIEVGDTVEFNADPSADQNGVVLVIDGDEAGVRWPDNSREFLYLSDLARVDPTPEVPQ